MNELSAIKFRSSSRLQLTSFWKLNGVALLASKSWSRICSSTLCSPPHYHAYSLRIRCCLALVLSLVSLDCLPPTPSCLLSSERPSQVFPCSFCHIPSTNSCMNYVGPALCLIALSYLRYKSIAMPQLNYSRYIMCGFAIFLNQFCATTGPIFISPSFDCSNDLFQA